MDSRSVAVPHAVKALVAIVFAALFFFGVQAPAAHASGPFDMTLNVTTKAGTPLAGLNVYAYPVVNHAIVGDGITANLGTNAKAYTFTTASGNALDNATDYAFYFDAPANATTAFDQFYGGTTFVEEAKYWHYVTNQTTLDVTLATNSVFTGKVTGTSSKVLSGVTVYPWRFDGNGWFRLDEAAVNTNSAGVYTMRDLEPGTYRLEFVPNNLTGYVSEFSGNTRVAASAAALTLGLGATVSYNAGLAVGGTVAGTVKLHDCGINNHPPTCTIEPEGITAYAFTLNSDNTLNTAIAPFSSRQTTTSGKWSIPGLPAGRYKIKLRDTYNPDAPVYNDKWAQNADVSSAAKIYTVVAGTTITETVAATMPSYLETANTSLELNVTDHLGAAIGDDTEVYIMSKTADYTFEHFLLQGGTTYFSFLPVGTYDVYVDPHDGVNGSSITTQTITSGVDNTWNIALTTPSAFTYSAPAQVSTGASKVGTPYTVTPGHTTLDDGSGVERPVTYSYIWLRTDAPIFGAQSATSNTYTSRGVDFGHKLSVIVRADSFGYAPVFTTIAITNSATIGDAAVSDPARPPYIGAPANPVPGSLLTANVGGWNATGLSFTYQWYRGITAIPGATGRTYTVQGLDADEYLSFLVTASRVGHNPSSEGSDDSVLIGFLPAPKQTKASTFKVTAIPGGERITATPGTWSPVPTSYDYDWHIGGVYYTSGSSPVFDCTATSSPDPCTSTGLAIEALISTRRDGYLVGEKVLLVRKGTALPQDDPAHLGFAYDSTDGGHPSFDNTTDPAYLGHLLQASNPSYTYPGPGADGGTLSLTYQWQRKTGTTWASISAATHSTYKVASADVGHELRIRVITRSTLYPTVTEYFTSGTGTALQDLFASPATVTIAGSPDIGVVKSAAVSPWPVSSVTQKFQWYVCNPAAVGADCSTTSTARADWKAISKATLANYTPPTTLNGQFLFVHVVGSRSGYRSAAIDSPSRQFSGTSTTTYLLNSQATITAGIVDGNAAVGRPLTAKPGATDRTTGVSRTYMWRMCNNASAGSCTDQGVTTLSAVPDKDWFAIYGTPFVQFTEQVSHNGTTQFVGLSPLYPLVKGTNAATTSPVVKIVSPVTTPPTYQVTGAWPAGTTVTYKWYDGANAPVASETFSPPTGPSPIVVEVKATRPGYSDLTYTLSARKGTFAAQPTAITSSPSGANRYGDTLTANGFSIPAFGGSATQKFQWYSGTTAISGKTTSTFVPSTAYVGKALKVKVTLSSPYYTTLTYYTPAVTLQSHVAATGAPVVVTSVLNNAPGSKLTANLSSFPSGMTYTYTWQRSVNGSTWTTAGTASSFTVPLSDLSKYIRVLVVAKRTGWATSAPIASAPVTVGYLPEIKLAAPFILGGARTVDGDGKVDSPLTISTAWNTSGLALSFSWTRNGVTIPGATGTSVTPTASWIGDEVQAHVTATKAGYVPATVHSDEVEIGSAAAPTSTALTTAPTAAKVGVPITVSSGVWTVAGLTLTYSWYDNVTDPGHVTAVATTATYTPTTTNQLVVVVTAKRAGYVTGTVSKTVAVASATP